MLFRPAAETKNMKTLFSALSVLILLCGCGGATVSVSMQNKTAETQAAMAKGVRKVWGPSDGTAATPSAFQMKIVTIYLAEDAEVFHNDDGTVSYYGNNKGKTSRIYQNPECPETSDKSQCDVTPNSQYKGNAGFKYIEKFFDFAQTSEVVNGALNSQGRAVDAATYKYVRVEFALSAPEAEYPNTKWALATPQVVAERGLASVFRGVTLPIRNESTGADEPLTLKRGETVVVNLAYDLVGSVKIGSSKGPKTTSGATPDQPDDCSGTLGNADYICFTIPQFIPTAKKK